MKQSAHQMFRAVAQAYPHAIAVIDGGRTVTYTALHERSDAIANRLRRAGAEPDDVVGILLPKSEEYIVAALGALKAGMAFLPLDPAYPSDWLLRISDQAALRWCISAGDYSKRHELTGVRTSILLDADPADEPDLASPGGRVGPDPEATARPDQLAYVIITSGSSGEPKGVAVPHAGLSSLVRWHQQAYDVGQGTVTTSLAEISFDASVWEIFGTICSGGTVVLATDAERADPAGLRELFERCGVTTAFLPTLTAERLLADQAGGPLHRLLTGGDVLHTLGPRACDAPVVINHYGPTETAVVATAGVVERDEDLHIGKPLPHVVLRVLDDQLRPVPAGTVGELCVGGDGVARGYLHQPGTTAGSFVPDPLGEPGARLYRTGDLGRIREDGTVLFVGRAEGFVKVRGYRVSLREIELAAETHPQVEAAAAVTVAGPDEVRVIGLCAAVGGAELTGLDLRSYLAERLPRYMLPSRFALRDRLPVSARGKVDRAALADAFAVPADGSSRPPSTQVEELLLLIWQQVLEVREIGVHDDFFELGGHSILATELAGLVKEQFELDELPLTRLYEGPTVAELASEIELLLAGQQRPELASTGSVSGPSE